MTSPTDLSNQATNLDQYLILQFSMKKTRQINVEAIEYHTSV